MFRAGSDNIENLQGKVRAGVAKLRGLDIGDELSIEILAQLIEGKKTVTEIVEAVYGLKHFEDGFVSSYGRVWREIRRLESKGLVSTRLLGRNKPYRLTQLAIINLAKIGGEEQQVPIIPRIDLIPYLGTVGIAIVAILQSSGLLQLSDLGSFFLLLFFGIFFGLSLGRALETVRRVF